MRLTRDRCSSRLRRVAAISSAARFRAAMSALNLPLACPLRGGSGFSVGEP